MIKLTGISYMILLFFSLFLLLPTESAFDHELCLQSSALNYVEWGEAPFFFILSVAFDKSLSLFLYFLYGRKTLSLLIQNKVSCK